MEKTKDLGLLILRVGMGLLFVYYGYKMFSKGPDGLAHVGDAMGFLGIKFAPVFWGTAAATAELLGGILVILGLGFRFALAFLVFTMLVAVRLHLATGGGFMAAAHATECAIVFFSLMFTGPGEFSLARKMKCC